MSSNLVYEITAKAMSLPVEKQREVLDFVEFIAKRIGDSTAPRRSLLGLWSDLGLDVSEEDIDEARREMWKE